MRSLANARGVQPLRAQLHSFSQGGTPIFLAQDDIQFRKPVEIGSLLIFTARIDLAPGAPHRSMQISVTAEVLDPKSGTRDVTNEFHFTFVVVDRPLRRVLPHTYGDAIRYVPVSGEKAGIGLPYAYQSERWPCICPNLRQLAGTRRRVRGSAAFKAHLKDTVPWVLPESAMDQPPLQVPPVCSDN